MTPRPAPKVDASALGQLLLMQSVLCGLPDERSIFGFACRGLSLIPGVTSARHRRLETSEPLLGERRFPLTSATSSWGELALEVADPALFEGHEPYVRNFTAMVTLILDERALRERNQRSNEELERSVQERTRQLTAEIAERALVEEQLQRSRDMLALTLDAVPQAIFWKDREGRFLGCNREFARTAGLASTEEIIGKTDQDMPWRSEDVVGYRRHDVHVIESGEPIRRIIEHIRRADGQLRWIETTKVPLCDSGGRVYGVLGIFDDVTDRHAAEQERESLQNQLAQAQKMESVGRLAGGVAHDFNNMLQAILGNASLALLDAGLTPGIREHIEEILKAAERSASLTQQLLAFARKQTATPQVLDLNRTVSSMLKMLKRLIGEDIQLEWKPAANLGPVRVDPVQIDQVLANLVVNARDAIKGVGVIRISTDTTVICAGDPRTTADIAPGDYITLTVADSGTGISPEVRAHLFEPFFTTKPAGQGTGLGLATVYGIVRQNRGTIQVESEEGAGAAFTVFLPRSDTAAAEHTQATAKRTHLGSETVLLVEDEEQILTLTQRILEQQGYTVLTASRPEQAIALAEHAPTPIHLLITDVIMPGMNGRELFQRISQVTPTVKCLFISGYTDDVLARDARKGEPMHFLSKPFTVSELTQRVRQTLEAPAK